MAYATNNLFLVDQGGGGEAQTWRLETTDSLATALASNYITDAADRGMKSGDAITVVQFGTDPVAVDGAITLVDVVSGFVISVSSSGALLGGGEMPYAAVPTADGTGTGLIPSYAKLVTVATVSDANHWLTLPAPRVGRRLTILNSSGTGMELRSSAPATIGISGGTGASAESAVASTALRIELFCVSLTNWIANSHVAASTESAVEAAA